MNFVIMAGGSGTRFWPMSRRARPKQFLNIVGEKPMVRATYERVRSLAADANFLVVVGAEHQEETERIFADTKVRVVVEPFGRNTAPCIALAAWLVDRQGETDPLVVLPADHYIADAETFRDSLRLASKVARQGGIVTLGIVPNRPETGYGYIERDDSGGDAGFYRVKRFVEKPDAERATRFLASGRFYWNAGIFVATPAVLLDEFRQHMADFARALQDLPAPSDPDAWPGALRSLYEKAPNISFDYGIMEKTERPVYVVPSPCGWSDVGSWYSLYDVRRMERDEAGNLSSGNSLLIDCKDSFVLAQAGRPVAVLGLENVLVVDTRDALLVADLARSQDVKEVTSLLEQKGLDSFL